MARRLFPDGLKARLLAVAALCLIPALIGSFVYLQRDVGRKSAEAAALTDRLADIGALRHEQLIGQARALLHVLASAPAVRDATADSPHSLDECVDILKPVPEYAPWATGAWLLDVDGVLLCDTTGPMPGIFLGDRDYFKRAKTARDFVLSGYTVGRRSGRQILSAAVPLMRGGQVHRVLAVSIELSWYNDLIKVSRDPNVAVLVLDGAGVALARQPQADGWMGRDLSADPGVRQALTQSTGSFVSDTVDGVRRAWSFRPLGAAGTRLLVGLPVEPLERAARRDLLIGLAFIAAAGALGFFALWRFMETSVLGWTALLVDGARRVGSGDAAGSRAAGDGAPDDELDGAPVRIDAAGAPREIAAVAAAFNLTTERLAARDRELAVVRRAAQDVAERLAAVLESTSDGVLAVGRDWRVTYANRRARALLNAAGELVGKDLWEAFGGDSAGNFERRLRRAMTERESAAFTEFFAGANVWYDVSAFPAPEGLAVYFRDVSARKQVEQSLRDAKERAEAANRAKSEFLAAVGHEIRTPLDGVVGFADMLLQTPLDAEQVRFAGHVRDAGRSLTAIIDDVLDYARLEGGRPNLRSEPFSVAVLIDGCVGLMRPAAERKKLILSSFIAPDTPEAVVGDVDRVRQVVLNLLSNAVKYTDFGRIDLTVEAGPGGRIVFTVVDTGIGVPEDRQRELFQRFTQIERGRGGAGLGLAICRRLAESMGGSVGLRSRLGAGSTFWFAAPLPPVVVRGEVVQGDKVQGGKIQGGEIREGGAQGGAALAAVVSPPAPARLLVVEDVAMNRELAAAMLRTAGYVVDTLGDGASAVEAVRLNRYDLVLMDVEMPGMSGLEAARAVRSLPGRAASTPILALTAAVGPDDVDRCIAAGMNGHVGKPIDRAALLAAAARLSSPSVPTLNVSDGAAADSGDGV